MTVNVATDPDRPAIAGSFQDGTQHRNHLGPIGGPTITALSKSQIRWGTLEEPNRIFAMVPAIGAELVENLASQLDTGFGISVTNLSQVFPL